MKMKIQLNLCCVVMMDTNDAFNLEAQLLQLFF
jgi:hypothetical protein